MKALRRYLMAGWFAFAAWRTQRHLDLTVLWSARTTAARGRLFPTRTDNDG